MSLETPQILFAIETTTGDVTRRLGRAEQRALADLAETQLVSLNGLTTRTHSRGLGAAARARITGPSQLGIDLEFADQNRNWNAILHKIAGDVRDVPGPTPSLACSIWTLAEAWYKAFGIWPEPATLKPAALSSGPGQRVQEIAPSTFWFAQQVATNFQLSIVWEGPVIMPVVACGADCVAPADTSE